MADYPVRQRFALAVGAPVLLAESRDPRELGGWDRTGIARARGEEDIWHHCRAYLERFGITTRVDLIQWATPRLHGGAAELARVVAVIGSAVWADVMSEDDAWHVLLLAGTLAQQRYRSWEAFGAACDADMDVEGARAVWAEIPWETDLGVTLVDASAHVRVLASACPACGGPRVRPSPTAFVYCDFCGALMDYDLEVAMANPAAQPGPVFEQLRADLAPRLEAARDAGDDSAYAAIQTTLMHAWVEACPTAVPIRAKHSAYRAIYATYLAQAQIVANLDPTARRLEAAMHAAIAALQFIAAGATTRVPADRFRALADAMFAYEARCDELFVEHRVYRMHPDGASRELQRRIGFSMFVQAWLPYLEPAEGEALLQRTALSREYSLVAKPELYSAACMHCGGPLQLVAGARKVVCEHCGRLADVVGATP